MQTGELFGREWVEITPGAVHLPGWLNPSDQRALVEAAREWGRGPAPFHSPRMRGRAMSVRMMCLGWHWSPYRYTRHALDSSGEPVLPLPDWLTHWGRRAASDAGFSDQFEPDCALVNFYSSQARMGMHQDKDEVSLAPVVSFSVGDTAIFRFGNTQSRTRPYQDLQLRSGDAFVFGGPARLAFHGVTRVLPGTAPVDCGLTEGRINLTLRHTGLADPPLG